MSEWRGSLVDSQVDRIVRAQQNMCDGNANDVDCLLATLVTLLDIQQDEVLYLQSNFSSMLDKLDGIAINLEGLSDLL